MRESNFRSADGQVSHSAPFDVGAAALVVRPDSLRLETDGRETVARSGAHRLSGTVRGARFAGTHATVEVEVRGVGALTVHAPPDTRIALGAAVVVCVPYPACTVVPDPQS